MAKGRVPAIMADAACVLLSKNPGAITGEWLIDEDVLRDAGVTDFEPYRYKEGSTDKLMTDLFLDA